ncbi:exportin-4-like [Sycon ciliatum]|uniref:exportin-4-like n=1 Tax=Sycon ciliatum TaxID=27933 RepID=UPI0031F6E311
MDMDSLLVVLDRAAAVLLSPPNVVSQAQRSEAEATFLSFRQSKHPFDACRHILEHSCTPYVQFIAASTICEALVREWSALSASQVDSLQTFLLTVVAQNPRMDAYIREKLLVACVIILKRCLLDKDQAKASQESLFSKVRALLMGTCAEISVGSAVLRAMIRECALYSSTGDAGLSWSSHIRCKAIFQSQCLPEAYKLVLEVLRQYSTLSSIQDIGQDSLAVLAGFLEVAEMCLSWDFTSSRFQTPTQLTASAFRPGKDWRPLVVNSDIAAVLFNIHGLCKGSVELRHLSSRCLAQLASLSGPVLIEMRDQVQHVTTFLQRLLPLLQTEDYCNDGAASLAHANIVSQIISAHSSTFWASFDESLCQPFALIISVFACSVAQSAHTAEQSNDSENAALFQESFDKLLECWLLWLTSPGAVHSVMLSRSLAIFEAYLSWHLKGSSPSYQDEEEVDELDEDDRVRYEDQLCSMGTLSRAILPACMPLMCQLLEERLAQWMEICQRCEANPSLSQSPEVSASLAGLYEDLHWLVLLSGHTLCYDCLSGETPTVPKPVRDFSAAQQDQVSADAAQAYMSALGQPITERIACPHGTDLVVRLAVDVMRVADFQRYIHCQSSKGLTSMFPSPQLSRSLFWYLRCWCATYVMLNADQADVSASLKCTMSVQGAGKACLQWLVDHMTCEMPLWAGDSDVLKDLVELLGSLTECPVRFHLALGSPDFWQLTVSCVRSDSWLRSADGQRSVDLLSALVKGCSSPPSTWSESSSLSAMSKLFGPGELAQVEQRMSEFLRLVLEPLTGRVSSLQLGSPEFAKHRQESAVKEEVSSLMRLLRGVFQGVTSATLPTAFSLFFGLCLPKKSEGHVSVDELRAVANGAGFDDESCSILSLINHYADHSDILVSILEFFEALASSMLPLIPQSNAPATYAVLLRTMQLYSKSSLGKFKSLANGDDEQLEDLLVFMKLCDHLISRDYWHDSEDAAGNGQIEGVDVSLCGLGFILPLITPELLQFPKMCEEYFRIVTFLAEFHAGKVAALPDSLFEAFVKSLELGLSNYGSEVMKMCLEGLASMAEWFALKGSRHPDQATRLQPIMDHFLKIVFNKGLVNQVDGMAELTSASEALFNLICCSKDTYRQLAQQLVVAQPNLPSQQRMAASFEQLIPADLPLVPEHSNKVIFRRHFQTVLESVRHLLAA